MFIVIVVPSDVNEQVVPSDLFTVPDKVIADAVVALTVIKESVSPVLHK